MKRAVIEGAAVPVVLCPCCGRALEGSPDPAGTIDQLGLGYTERAVALALVSCFGRLVKRAEIVRRVYAHRSDGGPENAYGVVNGYLRKLGKRLAHAGISVELKHRAGVRMRWAEIKGRQNAR